MNFDAIIGDKGEVNLIAKHGQIFKSLPDDKMIYYTLLLIPCDWIHSE